MKLPSIEKRRKLSPVKRAELAAALTADGQHFQASEVALRVGEGPYKTTVKTLPLELPKE